MFDLDYLPLPEPGVELVPADELEALIVRCVMAENKLACALTCEDKERVKEFVAMECKPLPKGDLARLVRATAERN